ncbi:Ku protein [Pseudaminobacter soli (ex Li et al. 2025)]|uniref:Non-homologous end joining protein Ku n=1 Tax=Pseudaminobacter soli (ex Li et al. 2025) TaxID=1295366 RepID=A0A2P7SNM5_9HYPH|nr:Ku protein [Mesorhizobium soli]PSJ64089.1 Ku protein [Mesorhizobium soli]
MTPRPAWKGYLKLSLVTCAVQLTNVTTNAERVSFRTINRETGNTVKRQYIDAVTGKPVEDKNEVKGYPIDKDQFLLVEEDEIEALHIESEHTMSLDGFVDKSEIEQIYLDTPYYLSPSDKVSEEAFAVIRDALAARKMAGLASIVLYRRERPAVIEPLGKGMLLTTLRYQNTVRKPATVFDDIDDVKIDDEMIELATHIIDKKRIKFDPSKFEDHFENALLEFIRAKKAGREPPVVKPSPQPSNVVNLFDALKKSLASEGIAEDEDGGKKPPSTRRASKAARKGQEPGGGKRKSA